MPGNIPPAIVSSSTPQVPADSPVLYRAVASVRAPGGPDKYVSFSADGLEVAMGMSGALAEFYGVEPGDFTPRPSTLDYLVGATAGCLLGTLRRALVARGVEVSPDALTCEAVGDVVVDAGVPRLTRIVVRYRFQAPPAVDSDAVERAHAVHHRGCAVSRSIESAVDITTELDIA